MREKARAAPGPLTQCYAEVAAMERPLVQRADHECGTGGVEACRPVGLLRCDRAQVVASLAFFAVVARGLGPVA